jgi:hypothetical protein
MIVYDGQHRPVELGDSVGHGGEAIVYRIAGQATLLAKIYEPAPRPNYAGKLGWMVNYPPENPTERLEHASLAWPGGLLYDARRRLKGYWMPYIQRAVPILEVYNPRRRAEVLPQFDRRYLLRTARNLAAALSALHNSGYVAGDLNESNILVTPTALITLIDTDSFQVSEDHEGSLIVHPCPVGKPEYTPPELQGQSLAEIVRQPDHDAFGLAVLIFQLLMDGSHPFRAQWLAPGDPPPLEVRIANGAYPYLEAPQYPVRPPKNAPGIETLHPWLVELFRRCFVDGHRDPRWRPGPDLWVRTLSDVEQSLIICSAGHYYFSHLASCPYCALAEERVQAQKQVAQKRPAFERATGRFAAKRPAWSPQPRQARAGMPARSGAPTKAGASAGGAATAAPAPTASRVSTGAQPFTRPGPGAGGRTSSAASTQSTAQSQPGRGSPRSANPFTGWATMFAPASGGSAPGIGFSPGGGAAVYGYPRFSRGVLRGRPMISPGMLQNWARVRAYKTLSIGGAQGALVGALPGALVGLANWTAGNPLAWAMIFSLGGAAGGLARGWAPGHKLASIINRFIGWKLFWEAIGLIAGAIGGLMLGLIFIWAIVPVFLGLILGAQAGLYVGRKLYQVGDMMGWERIWGMFSAASFGALGFGMAQILGFAYQNIIGAYLNTQLLPADSGAVIWALVWMLVGGITSGLGGALAGILADLIGRFSGLVD